jgi:outer membrane scaffolding protein for murein synthesis (MipA/OmpV family)
VSAAAGTGDVRQEEGRNSSVSPVLPAATYGSGNHMDEYFGLTPLDSLANGLPV